MIYKMNDSEKLAAVTPPYGEARIAELESELASTKSGLAQLKSDVGKVEYLQLTPWSDYSGLHIDLERWPALKMVSFRWAAWVDRAVQKSITTPVVVPVGWRPVRETQGAFFAICHTGNFSVKTNGTVYWWIQDYNNESGGTLQGCVVYECAM